MNASDIMTKAVVTVPPNAPIADALRLMLDQRIGGLPVVDKGRLVGILTKGDLLRRAEIGTENHPPRWLDMLRDPGGQAEDHVQPHGRIVEELMTDEVVTAPETASLEAIVALMENGRIRRVPIVSKARLVGIVSRADLLRALAHELEKTAPAAPDDVSMNML